MTSPTPSWSAYEVAFTGWLAESRLAGRIRRPSTARVYQHMWEALAAWAVGQGIAVGHLQAADLEAYLRSRGGREALTPRYSWRLLALVDRVLASHARQRERARSSAVPALLHGHADIRLANTLQRDDLPPHLQPAEAARLVAHLVGNLPTLRPRGASGGAPTEAALPWQEARNRASVALMLGAGLAPGEVRALRCSDLRPGHADAAGLPWKLRVASDGLTPERETPMARWAARVLQQWLRVRQAQGVAGEVLFPSTRGGGKVWSKVSHYQATAAVLQAAGLQATEAGGGSYRLRHTFALRQLRRGTPEAELERWLGVSDPSVMARYRRILLHRPDVA